ncbi:ABC transporter substrate-binding protein [Microbacterium barkeri]|uniref:ABC transporter substrate-binding protein n=1 Tax=Microbacterium TaxID=33882 RepID=UPI0024AFC93C|nr:MULTISPECIES: ABC transporter substrate-binding protein [Microbacterium]MDI6943185.1 ABC transporter substrate-binding protein [Microbacterium barkeri]WRH16402.1 extracellular solute-binding protein [Microbacterium sp. JZ37]
MRRNIVRAGAALLAVGVSAGMLSACTAGSGEQSSGTAEITMLVLGDKPTNGRVEAMLEKLNERLAEEVGATLDLYYVEWADWQTQYNVQLLSGDSNIDLITTATDWLFAWENAEKGAFLPLSEEMLQEHAPKTWEQVEADGHWDLTKLDDGQIYFIPEDNFTQWTNHGFFYRGDWAAEAGFENGEITAFEDFTTYFQWVKENKPEAYPWDVAGTNEAALTGYLQGHTDLQTIQQISAGIYYPFQTSESDPYTVTSWYMEGDELLEAAELAKEWNDIGVWREDALNYDGDTRELFYSGLSGADQHHTQTFVGGIVHNMNERQPGSDPKFFYWGQENGNYFRDILTHGAMAVSATSANPEKALEVYDMLRNDEESYRLINYGIEGTDYVITDDGKLDNPEGYDPSTDALGANFWAGRMDEYELPRVTDAENKQELYDQLDAEAKDYPYSTLLFNKDAIDPTLAAMGAVFSEYIPQLQYGKFDDPEAAIEEMRQKLRDAGYEDALASVQADMDAWAETQ